MLEWR